jgi:hypothetical protein
VLKAVDDAEMTSFFFFLPFFFIFQIDGKNVVIKLSMHVRMTAWVLRASNIIFRLKMARVRMRVIRKVFHPKLQTAFLFLHFLRSILCPSSKKLAYAAQKKNPNDIHATYLPLHYPYSHSA